MSHSFLFRFVSVCLCISHFFYKSFYSPLTPSVFVHIFTDLLADEDEFAVQPFDRSELSVVEHVVQKNHHEEENDTPGSTSPSGSSRSSVATLLTLSDSWKDSERKRIFKGILHSIQTTEHQKHRKYTQPTLFHYSSHH